MFDPEIIETHVPGNAARGRLVPPRDTLWPHSTGFLFLTYDCAWLNGSLPSFTTSNYTLLPVWNVTEMADAEFWSIDTTMFYADLTCAPANILSDWSTDHFPCVNVTGTREHDFTTIGVAVNGDGPDQCQHAYDFLTPWTSITHYSKNRYMYAWGGSQPNPDHMTKDAPKLPINLTAIYCDLRYYSQPVTANVTMPGGLVNHVVRTGTSSPFYQVDLTYTIAGTSGAIEDDDSDFAIFGYHPVDTPNVDSQLRRRLGGRPGYNKPMKRPGDDTLRSSSMVDTEVRRIAGLALSSRTRDNIGEMMNPETLAMSYRLAHQLLFAIAVADDTVSKNASEVDPVLVLRHVLARGFLVDRLWARGAQGALAIVTVITGVLAWLITKRDLKLDGEPNSLAEALRILAVSPQVRADMESIELYSPKEIVDHFGTAGGRYILELVNHGPRLLVKGARNSAIFPATDVTRRTKPWMENLWALRPWSGVGFLSAFGVVLIVLVSVFALSEVHDGE